MGNELSACFCTLMSYPCLVWGMVNNYPFWILIPDTIWMLTMSNSNPGSKQLIANLANNELQRLGRKYLERLRKISKLIRWDAWSMFRIIFSFSLYHELAAGLIIKLMAASNLSSEWPLGSSCYIINNKYDCMKCTLTKIMESYVQKGRASWLSGDLKIQQGGIHCSDGQALRDREYFGNLFINSHYI